MQTATLEAKSYKTVDLPILELTRERFAPYGSVIAPMEDGLPFGTQDAPLDLSGGTPRLYAMRIPARGLTVTRITRQAASPCTVSRLEVGLSSKCHL